MPTQCYLVTFDTAEPISVDVRHGMKEWLGGCVRDELNDADVLVNVDHLEPSEAHVAALLPPAVVQSGSGVGHR